MTSMEDTNSDKTMSSQEKTFGTDIVVQPFSEYDEYLNLRHTYSEERLAKLVRKIE